MQVSFFNKHEKAHIKSMKIKFVLAQNLRILSAYRFGQPKN